MTRPLAFRSFFLLVLALWYFGTGRLHTMALAQDRQEVKIEQLRLDVLSTHELVEALGRKPAGGDLRVCMEILERLLEATPSEHVVVLTQLSSIIKSDPQPERRFQAITCLTGVTEAVKSPEARSLAAETLRKVIALETDPRILRPAVRHLPDIDQSRIALNLLAQLLKKPNLLGTHREVAAEALLSAGRIGPDAIPMLVDFIQVYPEESMMAMCGAGSSEAVEVLQMQARSENQDRRYYAAHALGLCAQSSKFSKEDHALILATLEKSAGDADGEVRLKATESLRNIREQHLDSSRQHPSQP